MQIRCKLDANHYFFRQCFPWREPKGGPRPALGQPYPPASRARLPSPPPGPPTRDDFTRCTCSRTAHSTDVIRKYAHRVPSGSCAHLLPCTQEPSTPPDPSRPLAALHCGAPAPSPHAQAALFMGHALVRSYVVSRLQPVCSPCSRHRSLTPGPASGVIFALARRGAATTCHRRPSRCSVRPVHRRRVRAARRFRRRPLLLDSAPARLQLDRPFPAVRARSGRRTYRGSPHQRRARRTAVSLCARESGRYSRARLFVPGSDPGRPSQGPASTPRQMASCARPGRVRRRARARRSLNLNPKMLRRLWVERNAGGSRNRGWLERPVASEGWQAHVRVDVGIRQRRRRVARSRWGGALSPSSQAALDAAKHDARGRREGGHPPLPHQAGISMVC